MAKAKSLLITGGAGYIGSHVARQCLNAGYRVAILDRLSTGHSLNLPPAAHFVEGDVCNEVLLRQVLQAEGVEAVIHLAGSLIAEESVHRPDLYYQNNTFATLCVAKACVAHGVKALVYSSSAAVYGQPVNGLVSEDDVTNPINPYGRSKRFAELVIEDLGRSNGLCFVNLRYFNVAGVDPSLACGPRNPDIRSLFTAVCDTVLGRQAALDIYGTDCATPDGSCVRDFIEVRDLADIHVRTMDYLLGGGQSATFNCGYSRGVSVFDVVAATEAVIGRSLPVVVKPRRAFDPQMVVANPARLVEALGWQPRHQDLRGMVETSLAWARKRACETNLAIIA